jgi:SAM-dependent methyltransferase
MTKRVSLGRASLLGGLAWCLWTTGLPAQTSTFGTQQPAPGEYLEHLVPYVPTPLDVVQRMLEVAKVAPDDMVYDLGSGDGRIVIMAAQKFQARAVGVELDPNLYKQSFDHVKELGIEDRVTILHENMFRVDVHRATVVTLYLLTSVNERLRPQLEKQLRHGARVVSHDFMIPGWETEKEEEFVSKNGVSHKIYLYIRP